MRPLPRFKPSKHKLNRGSGSFTKARVQRSRPCSTNIEPSTNVFINYIPSEFTEKDLQDLCSQYGKIVRSKVMINLETGQSKCFGFVRFETLQQAQAAIRGLDGLQIGQKQLLAKYAQSKEKQEQVSTTVYIKRLPLTVDVPFVQQIFSKFGQIIQITPHMFDLIDPQSWRCVIRYTNCQSATDAINSMNNQIIFANSKPIHVRYADETRMSYSSFMPYNQSYFSQDDQFGIDLQADHYEMQLLPRFLLE
ncbi:RNA recognition motif-containing protein RRM [Histomonas meleagridis]|uniref:RNA recognition motif-containing protein RRM n=1 Tax=Histomonas meleagridis TaxID=135588 RepID=UPI0035594BBA|nr:RNA recognition motif-containing protein RRM [Histomonas meleagridis]KAH0797660.1 RNA recognition motif-containing protein RRM [Histomonas meleagridis]